VKLILRMSTLGLPRWWVVPMGEVLELLWTTHVKTHTFVYNPFRINVR